MEFTFKNDRFSLSFVEATIYNPVVAKGSICREMKVFPAECRGRKCTYKGKLVVSLRCAKLKDYPAMALNHIGSDL